MLFLYILIPILLISILPLIGILTRRASACITMKNAIEREGGVVVPTHKLWFIGNIEKEKCDLHVYFDGRVISAKIIGFYTKNIYLSFISPECYGIKEISKAKAARCGKVVPAKKKKKPYDFKAGLTDEGRRLPQARIILIADPYPHKITKIGKDGSQKVLHNGSETGEGELYNINAFLKLFK